MEAFQGHLAEHSVKIRLIIYLVLAAGKLSVLAFINTSKS